MRKTPRTPASAAPTAATIDKRNRTSQAQFVCRDCGFTAEHADILGADNIALRAPGTWAQPHHDRRRTLSPEKPLRYSSLAKCLPASITEP